MGDLARDRHGGWRAPTNDVRVCLTCGLGFDAPPSRIRWVFSRHVQRCATATQEERAVFKRTRKWPPRRSVCKRCGRQCEGGSNCPESM